MEAFVNAARSVPVGMPPPKEFIDNLAKWAEAFARHSWSVLDASQTQLTERQHTIGALGILNAKSKCPDVQSHFDTFVGQVSHFLTMAEPSQLRFFPGLLGEVCQFIGSALVKRKQASKGIHLMSNAIRILQTNRRQLTSIHAVLLELCLSACTPKSALPFLVDDIDDLTSEMKGTETKQLLQYFYYGGMIYATVKKFRQAIYFLEACFRVPANTLSHIMLEAYKKYILLCLLVDGEVPPAPKSAVTVVSRILKPSATAYVELATVFSSYNGTEINSVILRHEEVFTRDGNFGLIKQVKNAQVKLNIQRLTKTFLTLSLADVATRTQLPGGAAQAEKYILSMINDGEIYAKINQKDGMVVFLDNKEKYDSQVMMQKIENQISVCVNLNRRLTEMNEELAKNPDFISKVLLTNEDEGISSSKMQTFV